MNLTRSHHPCYTVELTVILLSIGIFSPVIVVIDLFNKRWIVGGGVKRVRFSMKIYTLRILGRAQRILFRICSKNSKTITLWTGYVDSDISESGVD